MTEEVKSWVGSSIEEIMCGISAENINQAPKVEGSEDHKILFQLPLPENPEELPVPLIEEDKWDDDHVKLPCNPNSIYKEVNESGEKVTKMRWNLIKESLNSEIKSSQDLERVIKSYNTRFEKTWNFNTLHQLFDEEFDEEDNELIFRVLIPAMVKLALEMPNLFKAPIPLMKNRKNFSISMSQQQAACLLANAFFCTFPNRAKRNSDYPEINFNRLFCSEGSKVINKLKCILNYFKIVTLKEMPRGVITFQRRFIRTFPDWSTLDTKFSSVKWHIDAKGTIEEAKHMLQVDFANRYLGGGVLGSGCVQEEIRFMINPECIVGMLFCECMKSDEAIYIYGSEQFSNYKGYASSFEWAGNYKDRSLERDEWRRKLLNIVAIDALSFHKPAMQFKEMLIKRELNKAFCGFYSEDGNLNIPIATGNWGCGAFRGYNRLKCLIQFMACAANKRNLVYYTFNDFELLLEMEEMFEFLHDNEITIAQLWKYMTSFDPSQDFNQFYRHIYGQFMDEMKEHEDEKEEKEPEKLEERTVEGCSSNEDENQPSNEEPSSLENPTKRMKIEEDQATTSDALVLPKNNKLITDYFTKTTK